MSETAEIRIDEHGDETHESWVTIRVNRGSVVGGPGHGARLFGSEISHHRIIVVTVARCTRSRDLNHDRLHNTETLLEVRMSEAQWGAFVSSFGSTGVPATLDFLTSVGRVPSAPVESRLDESLKDLRDSGSDALTKIQGSYLALAELFENGGGRKAQREALRDLRFAIENAPANMEFAATSLAEFAETVVTKARADIEGMITAQQSNAIGEATRVFELEPGEES